MSTGAPSRPPERAPREVRRRLLLAFWALIALLVVIVATALAVSRSINDSATEKYVQDAIPLKTSVQDLVLQMVIQQSAVRGYVITRSPISLRTYRRARDAAMADLAYIEAHLDGHPVLAALIGRADEQIASLERFYEAETGASAATDLADARRRVLNGTRRFVVFRRTADLMLADTDKFVRDARAAQDDRTRFLTIVLSVLGALGLAIAVLLAVVVPRRTGSILRELEEERAATALAASRAGALQRMTAALARALDDDAVIDILAREVGGTPGIGEVVLGRPQNGGERMEVRTLGATRADDTHFTLPGDAEVPVAEVARTGVALFFPTTEEIVEQYPQLPEVRPDRYGSWAILPMTTGRLPTPALALRFDTPREFDAEERTFLHTLADQCSQALERVRLHQEQVHIARALQQSLLPAELPRVPGLQIAARYSAAERAQEVGGDFYDVFEDGRGHLAVVVGDACGKGPEAAALTSLARYTIRAVATGGAGPAESLERLNAAILQQGLGTLFMTAAQVALTPGDGVVRMEACRAGHPHPLIVRASGEVEEIGATGRLLGIFDDAALSDVAAELRPGDALAVFTDGLTEARQGKAIMGEEALQRAAAGCAGLPAEECADLLLRAASDFAAGALRDDVAVVVVRVTGGPGGGPS